MQTRRRKNQLLIWIGIITLLLSFTVLSMPVSAQTSGVQLTTNIITGKMPGEHFTIRVYVWDVEAMWGYNFFLYYNTTVLTAVDYGYYDPFLVEFQSFIDDTAGLVAVGSSMPIGEPTGFYYPGPYAIAWIEFEVDSYGACLLDLSNTVISDIYGKPILHTVVDGYFANIEAPHDVAVTKVGVSPTRDIQPGEPVSINISVANQAIYDEDLTLTVKANSTSVGSQSVALPSLHEKIVPFEWDTTGFALGNYNITAEASVVAGETDTADNTRSFSDTVVLGTHDIAVTAVAASPQIVATGDIISINVTLANLGNFTENFNATTRYGYVTDTPEGVQPPITIETKPITSTAAGTNTTVTFAWNTTDVAFRAPKKVAYLWIEANVSKTVSDPAVPYETQTANNNLRMLGNVTVWLTGPVASFIYSASPLFEVYEGKTVTFDASASYSEGSIIASYKWDFGDGNITQVTVSTIRHIYITNGTYTVKLSVTDDKDVSRSMSRPVRVYRRDVAVLSVEPAATQVVQGKSVTIKVIVANQGDHGAEAFNVTLYYDNTVISKKTTSVAQNANNTVNFSWSTSSVSQGTYTLKAVAINVTGETILANNELVSSVTVVAHNVAVTAVTPSPTEVEVGGSVSISVTVTNIGNFPETFNVTAYYGDTVIEKKTVTGLAPGASTTLAFNWNTNGVNPDTYTIKAVADPVLDEVAKTDNTLSATTGVTVKAKSETPNILLYVAAGIGIAVAVVAIAVYFLKTRKPK